MCTFCASLGVVRRSTSSTLPEPPRPRSVSRHHQSCLSLHRSTDQRNWLGLSCLCLSAADTPAPHPRAPLATLLTRACAYRARRISAVARPLSQVLFCLCVCGACLPKRRRRGAELVGVRCSNWVVSWPTLSRAACSTSSSRFRDLFIQSCPRSLVVSSYWPSRCHSQPLAHLAMSPRVNARSSSPALENNVPVTSSRSHLPSVPHKIPCSPQTKCCWALCVLRPHPLLVVTQVPVAPAPDLLAPHRYSSRAIQ